jgi:hypothetical protein
LNGFRKLLAEQQSAAPRGNVNWPLSAAHLFASDVLNLAFFRHAKSSEFLSITAKPTILTGIIPVCAAA